MTEPIDQATKDLIAWIADTSSSTPWESQRMKIFGERIAKEIATVWAERLKQERNKAIDECKNIVRLDFDVKMGIADGLIEKFESLKDKSHE